MAALLLGADRQHPRRRIGVGGLARAAPPLRFYLGTHRANWLGLTDVPLFISRRTLAPRKTLPRALGPWALDSGGFTELSMFGGWRTTEAEYLDVVRRLRDGIGNMDWAAPMDWMVEPWMLERTGLDVGAHQRRTVANLARLRAAAPDLPIIPVLQGWTMGDYERCLAMYLAEGIDLRDEPVVGVGSVCRRQDTGEIEAIMERLASHGLRLHGFGVKARGLGRYADLLTSSDSTAWSFNARKNSPLPGHGSRHKNCANCIDWAMRWRERLLKQLESTQTRMNLAA